MTSDRRQVTWRESGIWNMEGGRGIVYLSVTGSKSEAGENSTGREGSWGISCFFLSLNGCIYGLETEELVELTWTFQWRMRLWMMDI